MVSPARLIPSIKAKHVERAGQLTPPHDLRVYRFHRGLLEPLRRGEPELVTRQNPQI